LVACLWASSKYAGTVMTASVTSSPRYSSASLFSFWRVIAEISGGEWSLSSTFTRTSPPGPEMTSYPTRRASASTSLNLRPIKRFIE
jgi:hypothetical protein